MRAGRPSSKGLDRGEERGGSGAPGDPCHKKSAAFTEHEPEFVPDFLASLALRKPFFAKELSSTPLPEITAASITKRTDCAQAIGPKVFGGPDEEHQRTSPGSAQARWVGAGGIRW